MQFKIAEAEKATAESLTIMHSLRRSVREDLEKQSNDVFESVCVSTAAVMKSVGVEECSKAETTEIVYRVPENTDESVIRHNRNIR